MEKSFKVLRGDAHANIDEIATSRDALIVRAAYEKAIEVYPHDLIELRHGVRVIEDYTRAA
jgi:hypothetical protein